MHQPVAEQARRDLVAFLSRQRRIVDRKRHGESRRIDRLGGKRRFNGRLANRIGHRRFGKPGDGDDIARLGLFHRHALQSAEGQQFGDAVLFENRPIARQGLDRHVGPRNSGFDAAGEHAAEIRIGFERGRQHGEGAFGFHFGGGNVGHDEIEQRRHILALAIEGARSPALLGRSEHGREIELCFGGVEGGEQIEHRAFDLARALIGAIDLVDDDDGCQAHAQRLAEHEFGLRHRSFGGVHQDQRAVDHAENALHLAAEIGVARRVDDIDPRIVPNHRGAFGENGDPALALDVVRIHGALGHLLVFAEGAALAQQAIDQGRLAVVDVGDDGDITKLHVGPFGTPALGSPIQANRGRVPGRARGSYIGSNRAGARP